MFLKSQWLLYNISVIFGWFLIEWCQKYTCYNHSHCMIRRTTFHFLKTWNKLSRKYGLYLPLYILTRPKAFFFLFGFFSVQFSFFQFNFVFAVHIYCSIYRCHRKYWFSKIKTPWSVQKDLIDSLVQKDSPVTVKKWIKTL